MRLSKLALCGAGAYLCLVLLACTPLIKDGAIHHGNGIAFLAATLLTFPLSWLLFWILDLNSTSNSFYKEGMPYIVDLMVLFFSAMVNSLILYLLASWLQRSARGTPKS